MNPLPRHTPREAALTIVEVVIAAMILLIVGVASTGVLASSVKTQSRVSNDERRMAVAEGIYERLRSETSWMAPGAANCESMAPGVVQVTCSAAWLNANFQTSTLADQTGTTPPVRYQTQIRIVGVDDAYDGQRQSDRDGTRPDYYTASVGVRRSADEAWFEVEGTIDPPGRVTTGALDIAVCRVHRQYDERIPISGCVTGVDQELLGYPAGDAGSSNTNSQHDWEAALDRARNGGNWDMVSFGLRPSNNVQVRIEQYPDPATGAQRDAVSPSWGGVPGCSASGNRKRVTCNMGGGAPEREVSGLIPGRYSITITTVPNGYEVWRLHSIPSNNTAIVEKGRRSRVLQVIRPVDVPSYDVDLWSCDHSEVQTWGTGPCVNRLEPGGLSAFLVPAPSSRAHWSDFASAPAGASRIRFRDLAPGLYSARMVTAGKTSLSLHQGPAASGADLKYLWINPVRNGIGGGHDPNSGRASWTRHWCDYARRVAFLSGVGLGPGGGNVPHTHIIYDYSTTPPTPIGTEIHQHYYYPATDCVPGGGGGGPPGPGTGGA